MADRKRTGWHWNCASALCKNNFRTKGVTYYTLPSDPEVRKGYAKVLMNQNVNWQKHVICSAHWSTGRKSKDQLPDVICTQEYAEKIAEEYSKKPTVELKRKLKCARRLLSSTSSNVNCTPRKAPASRTPLPSPPVKKRRISSEKLQEENATLKCQVETLTKELEEKRRCIDSLQQELTKLQTELSDNSLYYQKQLAAMRMAMEMKEFNYESLKQLPHKMFFMTGLTETEFDCLFECVEPFIDTIIYPDCKESENSSHLRKLDKKTELMCFLTICRHALHLGVMAWMTATSSSTMSRIFVGWCVFLSSIFESIDMTPLPGFVEKYIPKDFVEAGYSDTAVIGDATEVWISQSENYDLNNITFSSYKNHTTGKICVWTVPAGFLIHCTDAYPGSISDSDITEQSQVLDHVRRGKTVMTDKGFNITDSCHQRGLLHNRPPMKFNSQFDETEIVKNFDIATLRIDIENYIGRVRDWQILNGCWPSTRIDLLGYCFQIFAHIVNMLKKPIGPKR